MDYFDGTKYLVDIPTPVFLVNSKSGKVMYANRQAGKIGIDCTMSFFQMLQEKSVFAMLVKNINQPICNFETRLIARGIIYSTEISVLGVMYNKTPCMLITLTVLKQSNIQDEAALIAKICEIYSSDQHNRKDNNFLCVSARSVDAFSATLYEKRKNRYVIKEEWSERKNVCIPILSADFEDHAQDEITRVGKLKNAAGTAFATYKKTYGTLGVVIYYFDKNDSEYERERIERFVNLYRVLSPDVPQNNKMVIAKTGLNALSQGFVMWDAITRKVLYENKAYRKVFGYKNPQYVSENIGINKRMQSNKFYYENYTDTKGRFYSVTHTVVKLNSKDIVTTIILDITKYKQSENKLDLMAKTDALTGLLNRRAGLEILRRVYTENKSEREALTVCFADIDGLKYINDTYGHGAGDSMIKSVANVLKNYIDRVGTVCRLGGDEFLLILPGHTKSQARLISAQIDRDVAKCRIAEVEGISMSFGFKEADYRQGETANTLISTADLDMYREKRKKSAK